MFGQENEPRTEKKKFNVLINARDNQLLYARNARGLKTVDTSSPYRTGHLPILGNAGHIHWVLNTSTFIR